MQLVTHFCYLFVSEIYYCLTTFNIWFIRTSYYSLKAYPQQIKNGLIFALAFASNYRQFLGTRMLLKNYLFFTLTNFC